MPFPIIGWAVGAAAVAVAGVVYKMWNNDEDSSNSNENTKYEKLERIFITECGYLVKKTELEIKDDKKNRDNSKYRIVYKEVRYSKELKDKYDNMNKEDIKPYYTSEAIRKKYIFIKKLIENKI